MYADLCASLLLLLYMNTVNKLYLLVQYYHRLYSQRLCVCFHVDQSGSAIQMRGMLRTVLSALLSLGQQIASTEGIY